MPIGSELDILSTTLDSGGSAQFSQRLLSLLEEQFAISHLVLYRYEGNAPQVLSSASCDGSNLADINSDRYRREYWRRDTCYASLMSRLCDSNVAVSYCRSEDIEDAEFRHELFYTQGLAGRALVIGEKAGRLFGVSMFRSLRAGFFLPDEISKIHEYAGIVLSLVCTHQLLMKATALPEMESANAITERIELSLSRDHLLTTRQSSVCARLVLGKEIKDIARELEISAESVSTYRKRAFLHLGIRSREDLVRTVMQSRAVPELSGSGFSRTR